ncbi:uncharacterized protein BXZ73DRAFT_97939 [Epithele typhae]|uniref:uncharacterized protein n=1 Tax=Epithele typhae TaxID=378194 RepID=UPI002007B53A|nr:uncharacterized protein BXZ73DRAFT_97939 [Epithele typhae]KAH9942530.1 hypothetical protein BXZ73DRAFT_97939 [Epithele typhae]
MIRHACHLFQVLVVTQDAFPDTETQSKWAAKVWEESCTKSKTFYILTDRVKGLLMDRQITERTANARSKVRNAVLPLIALSYGFSGALTEPAKSMNRALYIKLLDLDAAEADVRFHYKDVDARKGFAQNDIILAIIQSAWFAPGSKGKHPPGVEFSTYFSPISEVTLALVFTAVDFGLNQWGDGVFVTDGDQAHFTEKMYKSKYDTYLSEILEWSKELAPTRSLSLRRMNARGLRLSMHRDEGYPNLPVKGS